MQKRITEVAPSLDRTTNTSICSAIGERLRRDMMHEPTELPSHLQELIDAMQRQDREKAAGI